MKEKAFYGKYFVIMMDLLGQKEMYKALEKHHDQSGEEFKLLLDKFVGQIEFFKKDVDSFLNSMEKTETRMDIPEAHKELVKTYRKKVYKVQRFSDGIMLYVPLATSGEELPVFSVLSSLICAGATMLVSLARGNPIRVGVGIGGGIELEDGELFGPAIGNAHEMESSKAIYPRIAVHQNVLDYLNACGQLSNSASLVEKVQGEAALTCRSMLSIDFDNELIFDYLGDFAWNACYGVSQGESLERALKFVTSEESKYFDEINKLAKKYSYVRRYILESGKMKQNVVKRE